MDSPFYSRDELLAAGFSSVGRHTRVSRKVSLYAISGHIGPNTRIDDFCILKGHLEIGAHVHICAYCSVSGVRGGVIFGNFSTLSNRVSIFTGSDDYRASALSSSTVPERFLVTVEGRVTLGTAALIGAHTVILPGATIGRAASVGALCIVAGPVGDGAIVVSTGRGLEQRGTRDVSTILSMADRALREDADAAGGSDD